MIVLGRRATVLIVCGIVAAVMQCVIGAVGTAHAYQDGNSYFENAGAGQPYTPNSSPYCAGASLIGDVIPNYMRPTDGCDFTGAVGERRMQQVTGIAPGSGDLRDKFFWVLYADYHSGDEWQRAGAAQVALSLLGYGFGSHVGDRTVTDAQWGDLRARITAPDIDMLWSSPNCRWDWCLPGADFQYNTAGIIVNGQYDSIRVNNGPGTLVDAWVFRSRSSGTVYATYEIECGNGIGNVTGLPSAQWSTGGWSLVGVDHDPNVPSWSATPGNTLYWRHGVYNNGPASTPTIAFGINKSGFSNGWNGNINPQGSFGLSPGQTIEMGYGRWWSDYSVYRVTQDDVGHRLCEAVSWGPRAWNDGSWTNSAGACVDVPYNYNLTTHIDMNTSAIEPGTAIAPINPYIDNAGPTKSHDDTAWQVSKFILAPGKAIPSVATNTNSPCAYYANGCVPQGTGSGTYGPGSSLVGQIASYTVEDLPIGSRVCFALSVNKYDQGQGDGKRWYHGQPQCVMIGKKPKVQVLGGDVATRAGISTSLTQKSTGVYGSWAEYGAFSVGPNINFATGAGLSANPTAQSNSGQVSWSKLTFANVDASKNPKFGLYYSSTSGFRQLANITQYFNAFSNKQPFIGDKPSTNAFATGDPVVVRMAGDLMLRTDQLGMMKMGRAAGQSTVIVSSGTVTIDGDLTYINGELLAVNQIPQLVIIAKNINITAKVQQVDAWLIATDPTGGVINTCSDGPVSLTGNDCNNPLTIHGPVEARQLLLRRTAGSGVGQPASGDPAEVIDMRADTYLWAQQIAAGAGKAQTVYMTELPPRF